MGIVSVNRYISSYLSFYIEPFLANFGVEICSADFDRQFQFSTIRRRTENIGYHPYEQAWVGVFAFPIWHYIKMRFANNPVRAHGTVGA